jgi:hypothetical protein
MVPPERLELAIRTKATVAYCSPSCRAVTQQRRYRDRKRTATPVKRAALPTKRKAAA